jgi:hypothetical protein
MLVKYIKYDGACDGPMRLESLHVDVGQDEHSWGRQPIRIAGQP